MDKETQKTAWYKDHEGGISSTRIVSFLFAIFFFAINLLIFSSIFKGNGLDIPLNTMVFTLTFDFLLLLAVFAPKELAKTNEIRKIIELTKIKENGQSEFFDTEPKINAAG